MIEKFRLDSIDIPYGLLHDQRLMSASLNGNQLTFSFDTNFNENDYIDGEFYERYKGFNRCDMIVQLKKDGDHEFNLTSSVDKHRKFNGLTMDIDEFTNLINKSEATFLSCYTNGYILKIEFGVNFYNSKDMSKYRKYTMFSVDLEAESVSCNWYKKQTA